jgi:hypothetical protein
MLDFAPVFKSMEFVANRLHELEDELQIKFVGENIFGFEECSYETQESSICDDDYYNQYWTEDHFPTPVLDLSTYIKDKGFKFNSFQMILTSKSYDHWTYNEYNKTLDLLIFPNSHKIIYSFKDVKVLELLGCSRKDSHIYVYFRCKGPCGEFVLKQILALGDIHDYKLGVRIDPEIIDYDIVEECPAGLKPLLDIGKRGGEWEFIPCCNSGYNPDRLGFGRLFESSLGRAY